MGRRGGEDEEGEQREEGERVGEDEEGGEKREEGERGEPDEDILLQHCLLSPAPWYYYNRIIFITPVS